MTTTLLKNKTRMESTTACNTFGNVLVEYLYTKYKKNYEHKKISLYKIKFKCLITINQSTTLLY